jgi:hypothetical protein
MQSQTAVDLTQTARAPAQEPRGGSLTITARYDLPQPVLIVVGELDRTSMPLLVAMLEHAQPLAQDPGWIAVDLTRVTCTESWIAAAAAPARPRPIGVRPLLRVSSLVRPSEPMQAGSEDGVPAGA